MWVFCVADCLHYKGARSEVPHPPAAESFFIQYVQRKLVEASVVLLLAQKLRLYHHHSSNICIPSKPPGEMSRHHCMLCLPSRDSCFNVEGVVVVIIIKVVDFFSVFPHFG